MNDAFGRRKIMQAGAGALLSTLVTRWLEKTAFATGPTAQNVQPWNGPAPAAAALPKGKAKAVIVLWMNGGPSHIDTWDPKPGAPTGGSHKSIKTATPGVSICEHMPRLAAMSQRLAIVRSVTSKEGNHQRAQYLMRTGYAPNPTIIHPSMGGWTSKKLGEPANGLPGFVSLGGPSLGAGFLGVQYGPFVLQRAGEPPQNVAYGADTDAARFQSRYALLDKMEQRFAAQTGDAKVDGRRALYKKAVALMQTPDLGAFDISKEPDAVKNAFGGSDFAKSCLTAVRLVQSGVKYVEVTLDGWDTHKDNFTRTKNLMSVLDPGMSGVIDELAKRRLLDSTLVVWMGDFGRTPRINGNDGRDHYPQASSVVLAGAGIRGGQAYGETDANGEKIAKNPVAVPDLMATIATVLGMDPTETFLSPIGRPIAITNEGSPIRALLT
jgi:uncharacterized protein (DUF1501 family)